MTSTNKRPNQAPEPEMRTHVRQLIDAGHLDDLMGAIDSQSLRITGQGGFINEMIKAVMERALAAELTSHLGYENGDREAKTGTNTRNGRSRKTVTTTAGDMELAIPRDRDSTFTPQLVPKGERRLAGIDEMIISLYANGMTTRDIEHHLASTMDVEVGRDTISKITDAVLDEVVAWQNKPLDEFYPIMYLDAIMVKIRDGAHVANRAARIAIGVDMSGTRHVLGIWLQATEGAKFWAGVCAELANRGVKDVLIVCCDGLTGFPEAIEATWPLACVQTCTVHLLRASMRFVSYKDRRKVAASLKNVYTAASAAAAKKSLREFADSELGVRYPMCANTWVRAWDRFIPFLAFPDAVRKIIYTTNAIESLNYQLRKVTKTRGHFPSDQAAVKLLWLAIREIESKRARERAKIAARADKAGRGGTHARLVEGASIRNWPQALNQLAVAYPDRVNPYL